MINSLNKNQSERWKYLFSNKYNDKYIKSKFQNIEYWYYANKRAIKLVQQNNIKHLILSYENLISSPKNEIKKIFDIINKKLDISKYSEFISKLNKKTRTKDENISNIPNDLIELADQINKEIK